MDEYNCIDHKKLSKIVILCEKCFDYLLINKKGQLKMDHMTYYLMLIINNLYDYLKLVRFIFYLSMIQFY